MAHLDTVPSLTDPPDAIIAYLERLLAVAKERRVLFLIASAGVVGAPAGAPPRISLDTRAGTGRPGGPSEEAPVRKYGVELGAFVGPLAERLGPRELASAMSDCVAGARYAEAGVTKAVADRVEAALPPTEKKS
jgi:hypothetical protein